MSSPEQEWKNIHYFTYGSNMKSEKLKSRVLPDGNASITYSASNPAYLPDWTLVFDLFVAPPQEPAMASIEPSPGAHVYGVAYTIDSQSSWDELLDSEGGKENCYRIVNVEIQIVRDGHLTSDVLSAKTLVTAWQYMIPRPCRPYIRPSRRYCDILIQGANEHCLPALYVEQLEAIAVARKPKRSLLNMILPVCLTISYVAHDFNVKWAYWPLSFTLAHLFCVSERAVVAEERRMGWRVLGFAAYVGMVCVCAVLLAPGLFTLALHSKCRTNLQRYKSLVAENGHNE